MLTIISSRIKTADEPTRYWRVKGKTGPDHPYPGTVLQNHGKEKDVTPGKFKMPQFEEEQEIPDVPF